MTAETIAALEQQNKSLRAEVERLKEKVDRLKESNKQWRDVANENLQGMATCRQTLATTEANNALLREALSKVRFDSLNMTLEDMRFIREAFNATKANDASQQEASEWLDKLVMGRLVVEGVVIDGYEERIVHWRDGFIPSLGTKLYRLTSGKEGK